MQRMVGTDDKEVAVFLTRSLRRKMVCGLGLVLVMLVTLAATSLSGLTSIQSLVDDLDRSVRPLAQISKLSTTIGKLLDPIARADAPPKLSDVEVAGCRRGLREVRDEILAFRRILEELPPTPSARSRVWVTEPLLESVVVQAAVVERQLAESDRIEVLFAIANLQALAHKIPDPQEGLYEALAQAGRVRDSRLPFILATSAIVVLLFLSLAYFGYRSIFAPLRRLHRGALQVANGDFDYRLPVETHDEMAEVAVAFNQMTSRFQETTEDLDRQVRERSKQLVRSERLAGVGFLAAGVAHEINNPLTVIAMTAESLEGRLAELLADVEHDELQVVHRYLELTQKEAQRCQGITAKLLDFSRGQDGKREWNDVAAITSEVVSMVEQLSKYRDRQVLFEPPDPCWLEVNEPEIKQVILNLAANALESTEEGGRVEIRLVERTDRLVLTIRDDGIGMTTEVLDNIFEPFFTKRRVGQGTGLGLAISHRIVADHGGTIEATSDGHGEGSTFTICLPRPLQRASEPSQLRASVTIPAA